MHTLRSALSRPAIAPASPFRDGRVVLLASVVMLTALGCDSAPAGKKVASASKGGAANGCSPKPGVNPGALAVADYIKTTDPAPLRFLTAAGTDTAVSDEGMAALQDKGPTYFYAGKETQKAKVREKLEQAGPFTALLVVMRADRKNADGTRTIDLGGHFVTGKYDGKETPSRSYTFKCDTAGWALASKKEGSGQ